MNNNATYALLFCNFSCQTEVMGVQVYQIEGVPKSKCCDLKLLSDWKAKLHILVIITYIRTPDPCVFPLVIPAFLFQQTLEYVSEDHGGRVQLAKRYYDGLSQSLKKNFGGSGLIASMEQCNDFFFLATKQISIGRVGIFLAEKSYCIIKLDSRGILAIRRSLHFK